MSEPVFFTSPSDLDKYIQNEARELALEALSSLSLFVDPEDLKCAKLDPAKLSSSPGSRGDENNYFASVLFMGPVFGEFTFSVPEQVADRLLAPSLVGISGEERVRAICETLAEALNQSAGKRLQFLNQTFKRLTIAVPKVVRGRVMYRNIRSADVTIRFQAGEFGVGFYIDQMQTDLAEAHREMIKQLRLANAELSGANERLKEQQAQLVQSEKMATLGVMAAGVAHEINNPLSFVMANTDTLASYVDVTTRMIAGYSSFLKILAERQNREASTEFEKIRALEEKEEIEYVTNDSQKLIEESRVGLDRIRKIVNGLKRFSRLEDQGIQSAQINDEIVNTLELLRNELKYSCKVELDLGPVPEISCIPTELSQVLINLVTNAIHAMPESGGKIWVQTREERGVLVIRVRDNGSGMSAAVADKIFQPFFTTKPAGKGTGLGLSISANIVARHGGELTVESRLGEGTCFSIRIPYPGIARNPSDKSVSSPQNKAA